MTTLNTLGSFFTWRCQQEPDALAYAFVRDTLEIEESLSFAQLRSQVEALAARVQAESKFGDRVLLVYPSGLDFVRAFWACMLTGRIAVPVPAPDAVRFKNNAPRLRAIIRDAQATLVLTNQQLLEPAQAFRDEEGQGTGASWIATDLGDATAAPGAPAPAPLPVELRPESIAYLQYTSGSTSSPRGVILTHANVLAQARTGAAAIGVDSQRSRLLCWLPHFHDYGLVFGSLVSFCAGVPSYLMSPLTFLRRPLRWLEAVDRFRISHTGAPNFAYVACVKALAQQPDWHADLSTLVSSSCGAEPIHPDTPQQFQTAFAPHGLRADVFAPAYGMAETVLGVTATPPAAAVPVLSLAGEALARGEVSVADTASKQTRRVVGCGVPFNEMSVLVVDPHTLQPSGAGRVGEFWVQGSSVGQGYWQREQMSRDIFGAHTAGGDGPYLRTGDLGFIRDGQLFVTGRLKDLVIVRGRNHAPQDIEWTVQHSSQALRAGYGAAFSISTDDGEALGVVQEVERGTAEADLASIARTIRRSVAAEHDLPIHALVLIRAGTVPRTTSGKIRRQSCKQSYLEGTLDALLFDDATTRRGTSVEPPVGDVEMRLAAIWATALGFDSIGRNENFFDLGGNSLLAMQVITHVSAEFERDVTLATLFDAPTVVGLAQHLAGLGAAAAGDTAPIPPCAPGTVVPLSPVQMGMWLAERLGGDRTAYRIVWEMNLRGALDRDALRTSLQGLVERHDSLRLLVREHGGTPQLALGDDVTLTLREHDLGALPAPVRGSTADRLLEAAANEQFDLGTAPLARAVLIRLTEQEHVLQLVVHHLVCDGWSMTVLRSDLAALYASACGAQALPAAPRGPGLLDWVAWEQSRIRAGALEPHLRYWTEQLRDLPLLNLPFQAACGVTGAARSASLDVALDRATATALHAVARQQGATMFMLYLAALKVLLMRWCGQDDIAVGTPIARRDRPGTASLVGPLLNTLVLRTSLSGNPSFAELVARVRGVALAAFRHKDQPFDSLVAALNPPRVVGRNPLFDVLVNALGDWSGDNALPGLVCEHRERDDGAAKFALTVYIRSTPESAAFTLNYRTDLLSQVQVQRLAEQFRTLLGELAVRPQAPIASHALSRAERALLPDPTRRLGAAPPARLHDAFCRSAAAHPHAVALTSKNGSLTYAELEQVSRALAQRLLARGAQAGDRAAIVATRDLNVVVAMLGCARAGMVFAVLDAAYPAARNADCLAMLKAQCVIDSRDGAACGDRSSPTLALPSNARQLCAEFRPDSSGLPDVDPRAPAYVVFTSGTTGRPKAVVTGHAAVPHFIDWHVREHGLTAQDRFSLLSGLAHDPLLRDVGTPLALGATLCIPDQAEVFEPRDLVAWLARERVSVAHLTPAVGELVANGVHGIGGAPLAALRRMFWGGERLGAGLLRRLAAAAPGVQHVNFYGTSETPQAVAHWAIPADATDPSFPIGHGIDAAQLLVLSGDEVQAAIGHVGEILVRTPHLALGYLDDTELTRAKFVSNPFTGDPDDRCYRTGDLGRYRADGGVEFLGRADQQVKIRGFRIEPAEIERAAERVPGVARAVVRVLGAADGTTRLALYYTATGAAVTDASIRDCLQRELPGPMWPQHLMQVESFPVLAGGKLDWRALPVPDPASLGREDAPVGDTEVQLAQAFATLLGVASVGRHDNFFALGGHSLLAAQLVSRLRETLAIELPLRAIFEAPTVADLATRVRGAGPGKSPLPPIVPLSVQQRSGVLPLSSAQRRMWFWHEFAAGASLYNVGGVLSLRGLLDVDLLEQCLFELLQRHEVLRSRWVRGDAGAGQRIDTDSDWRLQREAFDADPETAAARCDELAQHEGRRGFDLYRECAMRATLVRLDANHHRLLWTLHHSVCDGTAVAILMDELCASYDARSRGRVSPLASPVLQYTDFAVWEQNRLAQGVRNRELAYWTQQLADAPPSIDLPADHPRSAQPRYRAAQVPLQIIGRRLDAVREFAHAGGATLFMTVLAAWQLLLHRYSGQSTVVTGTVIANRDAPELERLVGFLANTVALRTDFEIGTRVSELLAQVKSTTLGGYENQHLPFEEVVEALNLPRSAGRTPLIQTMVVLQPALPTRRVAGGVQFERVGSSAPAAKFDLTLELRDGADGVTGALEYDTDLYEASTARRLVEHWLGLLDAMCAAPDAKVANLPLLSAAERVRLLAQNSVAAAGAGGELPLPSQFEHQVERTPNAIAVRFGDQRLSYRQLNARANQLARCLGELGVGPDIAVGVCLERSVELLVALLAVHKAGGAVVPLEPELPPDRHTFMLEDTAAAVLLSHSALRATSAGRRTRSACREICLDTQSFDSLADTNPERPIRNEQLAYIVYTSGSTGQPKGVLLEHAGLANHAAWLRGQVALCAADRSLALTSIGFDASLVELLHPLLCGATVVLAPPGAQRDTRQIAQLLDEHAISVLQMVPSALRALLQEPFFAPSYLRYVISGGEALDAALARELGERLPDAVIGNFYGPTETSIDATFCEWRSDGFGSALVPIGRPVAGATCLIFDPAGEPVPPGVAGELYIGGAGLARAYLNRADLTAQRFVAHPLLAGERLYRTGDLVRQRGDGLIDYLGRIDSQVKLRGYRIELGEIEAALNAQEGVTHCAVLADTGPSGATRLVAYVAGDSLDAAQLDSGLRRTLPDYMVPSAFVLLNRLPLLPNGKLDRKALPAAPAAAAPRRFDPPRPGLEAQLASIWGELLGVDRVSRDDTFFELGGHSLMLVTLVERMRRAGIETTAHTLFEHPTVGRLAAQIETAVDARPAPAVASHRLSKPMLELRPELLPLVTLDQAEINTIVARVPGGAANVQDVYPLAVLQQGMLFHHLLHNVGDAYLDRIVLGFDSRVRLDRFLAALQSVIDRHDALRTAVMSHDLRQPVQVVLRHATLPIVMLEVPPGVDPEQCLLECTDPARVRLDLQSAPMMKATLAPAADGAGWLLSLLMHHMGSDHVSLEIIWDEIQAFLQDRQETLAAPVPLRDFVARACAAPQIEHEAYFRTLLGDVDQPTAPFGLTEVHGGSVAPEEFRQPLDPELARRLRRAARAEHVAPAALFHVAFGVVLAACSGRDDVVFGSVLSGRMHGGEGIDRAVGLFMNTLPVRLTLAAQGVQTVLAETQKHLVQLIGHEQAPLAAVQRCSAVPAELPLFSALLNYRHSAAPCFDDKTGAALVPALIGVRRMKAAERTNYPLALTVDDAGEGFTIAAQCNGGPDPRSVVAYLRTALDALARALEYAPASPALALNVVPEAEIARTTREWNQTSRRCTMRARVDLEIAAMAARHPDRLAIVAGDDFLTYGALMGRVNQLARCLRTRGVKRGARVGLCLDRSPDMVVAQLAVLRAGAAYVPLDPTYPTQRLRFMLHDAAPTLVLTRSAHQEPLGVSRSMVLLLDTDAEAVAGELEYSLEPNVELDASAEDPAYLIYTSGSTGQPKGVLVPHCAVVNFLASMAQEPGLHPRDHLLAVTTLSFDIAVLELLLPLCVGAQVTLASRDELLDGAALRARLETSAANVMQATPSTWRSLLDAGWMGGPHFKALIGGEALPKDLARQLLARCGELWNLYGPTETTVWSSAWRVDAPDSGISIGQPIANTQIHILDSLGRVCPVGAAGEIYIGGAGVAIGYHARPELTSTRFVPDRFSGAAGARLYRTGDRGRWRRDGLLEHLGRLDQQVKLRGHRIELGEIEAALADHAAIARAVVTLREEEPGDVRLVGYLVARTGAPAAAELSDTLRDYLKSRLPAFMLPQHLVMMDAIPLLPNGKIDHKALPRPSQDTPRVGAVAPRNGTERQLWEVWREVLKLESFGVEDSFFELGGHSLLAMQVQARVRDAFGVELPLRSLFEAPRLADQAAAVERALQVRRGDKAALPPIRRLSRDGLLPTSYSQRRMWLIQQFNPDTTAYNMPLAVRLRGALDRSAFAAALQRLIERHEAFRTTLVAQDGEPMQRIVTALPAPLDFIDLRELPARVRVDAARELLRQRSLVPYRLAQGPLHRMLLVQLDAEDQVFFWSMHHAIGDGWSTNVLMRELALVYAALLRHEEPVLEPKAIDFADYAAWQREVVSGTLLDEQLAFWRQATAGLEPLPLPTDRPRRGAHDGRGSHVAARIPPATLAGVKALAVEHRVTPFMALLAVFQLLLSRCSGVTDIAVGTPIANRTQRASEAVIGTLVNTIVMRTELAGNPGFTELLQRVRETALQAYAHQDLPFELLVEELALPRSEGISPLVQVLFNVHNPSSDGLRLHGVDYERFDFDSDASQFDLGLSIDTEIFGEAQLSFSTALFDAATGERLLASYLSLLDQVVAAPQALLSSYRLVDAAAQRALAAWNECPVRLSASPVPHLHGLIDAQAQRTPQRVALRSSTGSLRYAELAARSNQLARLLRARGIGRGALVGLCVERSVDMVVAQLAVLKAGAAYVPLDPAYPAERIAHMCSDAQLALLITESEVHTPHWLAHKSLLLDLDRGAISGQDAGPLAPDAALDAGAADPAYVIYTSGSTGKPKGVVVPHGAAVNFLRSMAQQPGLNADDALVAVTTLSFDIAVLELLLPLTLGAQVVLASRKEAASGKLLRKLLEKRSASVMQATPSTWRMLIEAGWMGGATFKALIGGEALPSDLADQLRARTGELWNMYGPTETTVWSTCWRVEPGVPISIGRPIANTQVHVLDPHGGLCPIGVAGEIFIGGDGVAIGYLNRPELTAERFVPDRLRAAPGGRLYRTGDRGRWRNDGLLEHLGRLDHQVKVRGHRIELGEIEATFVQHSAVGQAVVIVREDVPGDVRLVAYLIARAGAPTPSHDALRDHLRATLPDYMLPQHLVWLDALPLLPNGKLNRQALPLPIEPSVERVVVAEALSPLERAIAEVWQELLGVSQVGLRDNFFDLGGHSLLAVRAVAAIEARTGLQIDPSRMVFESLAQLGATADEPAETQY